MATATENAVEFANRLNIKFTSARQILAVKAGRKYDKIVWTDHDGRPSSVFAFVERNTGDLYKAGGYNVPAKHARYSGNELLTVAVENADEYGRFLYRK